MSDLDFQPAPCGEVRAFAATGVLGSAPTADVDSAAGEARASRVGMRIADGDRVWGASAADRMGMRDAAGSRVGDAENTEDRVWGATMDDRVCDAGAAGFRTGSRNRRQLVAATRKMLGTRMGDAGNTGEPRLGRGQNWGPHGGCGSRRRQNWGPRGDAAAAVGSTGERGGRGDGHRGGRRRWGGAALTRAANAPTRG